MRVPSNKKLIAAFALVLVASAASAATSEEERRSMLYLESIALPQKAAVCEERLPGFKQRFAPAFEAWRTANKGQLAAGEDFLRAEAAKSNQPFLINVAAVTVLSAQMLQNSSPSILKENCDAMLAQVGAG